MPMILTAPLWASRPSLPRSSLSRFSETNQHPQQNHTKDTSAMKRQSSNARRYFAPAAAWWLYFAVGEAFITTQPVFHISFGTHSSSSSSSSAVATQHASGRTSSVRHLRSPDILSSLAAAPSHVEAPGQWSPVGGPEKGVNSDKDEEDDFNINVGRALDYLAADVPLMFSAAPRLQIFTPEIRLKDPVGELCHGRRLYGALHTSLRVFGAIAPTRPRVSVTSIMFYPEKRKIELKWTIAASAPFMGDAVKLSAVSLYQVNDHGLIYEHSIDNRIKRDLWEYSHSWMGVLKADSPPSI